MQEMQHVVSNGLRRVVPYWNTTSLFAKGRWLDRAVLEVFQDEFKSRTGQHYLEEIKKERIQVIRQDQAIKGEDLLSLKLQNKDVLRLTLHKHEPLVVYQKSIPIVFQNDDMVVVNKPSSIPVHPTGRYFQNTLTELLKEQLRLDNVYPCYRLDKLTSGILVLGKSPEAASRIQKRIMSRDVRKHYLARVIGSFPDEEITCEEPVGNIDTKLGFTNGVKERKQAKTIFKRLKYSPELDESIVSCRPLTGRTHQIRIHLNYLKHPIVNDPLYGPDASSIRNEMINSSQVTHEQFEKLAKEARDRIKDLKDEQILCEECGEAQFEDPKLKDMVLWLHAFEYDFDDFHFQTDEPDWCEI